MRRHLNIITPILLIINIYFAFVIAQHNWDTQLILSYGGVSNKAPDIQSISQLLPFAVMSPQLLAHMPHFIFVSLQGDTLFIVRAIGASFLHFSWSHVINNMIVLAIIGYMFEETNYFGLLLPVYLITGVVSMIGAITLQPNAVTAGASGAIFGILGTMVTLFFRAQHQYNKGQLDNYILFRYKRGGEYAESLIVLNLITSFLLPNISIVGHITGLIAGLILGFVIPLKRHD